MTAPSLEAIQKKIKKWSDKKLFKEVDRIADYTPEVRDLINQEIDNRKIGCKPADKNPEQ
jgi:ribosomal protein S25